MLLLLLCSQLLLVTKSFPLRSNPSSSRQLKGEPFLIPPAPDESRQTSQPQRDSLLPLQATLDDRISNTQPDNKKASDGVVAEELKESFISQIETSLQDKNFVSLTLWGPAKSKKKNKSKKSSLPSTAQDDNDDDFLRGCVRQVQFRRVLIKQKEILQATFKYHGATDIAKNWPLENLQNVRQALGYILDPQQDYNIEQMEDFVPVSEWGASNNNSILGIQKGRLTTLRSEVELDIGHQTKKPRLKQSKLNKLIDNKAAAVDHHDRVKQVPLDTKADFLQALGVTNAQGKPKQAMASKLRQCQKFVEIVANLVDRVSSPSSQTTAVHHHPPSNKISVCDLGCGRGYLTFSLHAYLQQKYKTGVESIGVDLRPKLVNEINGIATSLGQSFSNLRFQEGSIEDMLQSSSDNENDSSTSIPPESSLDILIALHACDTATDDALWCGISRQADIIVVAPCCHKQVRQQLNAHMSGNKDVSNQHPLADMLQHNVYRERHSEMVTDSLRALLLELAGYQVQVFEFVGGEHTAKNVMITAVRNYSSSSNPNGVSPNNNHNKQQQEDLRKRIHELASLHGIQRQKLAQWMGAPFLGEESLLVDHHAASPASKKPRISSGGMPPL